MSAEYNVPGIDVYKRDIEALNALAFNPPEAEGITSALVNTDLAPKFEVAESNLGNLATSQLSVEDKVFADRSAAAENTGHWQVRPRLRRLSAAVLAFSLVTGGAIAEGVATAEPASANTITTSNLGYPWAGAPCEFGGTTHTANSSNPDCTNPNNPKDTNDWGETVSGTFQQYRSGIDGGGVNGGGYEYDNCTDFVDWIVDSNGGNVPSGLGNGGNWYNAAPPSDDRSSPAAGEVAVAPGHNHVAYIESVSGSNITVEEYNQDYMGNGDTQTGTPASMGFTEYLNFGGTPAGGTTPPTTYKPNYLAAATNAGGEIELFAVGTDHNVYWTRETSPNNPTSWTNWGEISANADSITAAENGNGELEEFTVGPNGSVYYRSQQTPGVDNWGNEQSITANLAGPISAATNTDGTIELFATGTNNDTYWSRQSSPGSTTWGNWGLINGSGISSAATPNASGALSEFTVGASNPSVYYRSQQTPRRR
jgi:hypothetical protein